MNRITPLVTEIKGFEKQLETLSNDKLRAKTVYFKNQIAAARAQFDEKIFTLLEEVKLTQDLDEKENIYKQVDEKNQAAQNASEDMLNQILPEAFAVVKETAKRFKENETLEVSASAYDREMANSKPYIRLKGDQACLLYTSPSPRD